MSIFKRGSVYWYHFLFNGEHIQESTKQGNPRTARQIEAAHRTRLAMGEVGIKEHKAAPLFLDFAKRFIAHVEARHENKPQTVQFYAAKLNRLLEYPPIAGARLDHIDEGIIEGYVVARRASVGPATVNRELATLRRMLRLAHEWKEINRVPKVRLLNGERIRDFVLSRHIEEAYLAACAQPLADIALLVLEAGLRIGEALSLPWTDVVLDPLPGSRFGYLRVRDGKSKNARRILPLTDKANEMLRNRQQIASGELVFANREGRRYLVTSINHLHQKARALVGLGKDFVIHSLRHTMLTRLGESGVDAFTIMKIAGHSSITVSQRYVHPSPEAVERAFERLQLSGNQGQIEPKRLPPAIVSATLTGTAAVSH
ncbi:MAG TPA: site-specific integrase [Candidatus Limnocylindrales bacterium]|nr:site-specific integrase [Candidatus Limnocylindrales bacterium]